MFYHEEGDPRSSLARDVCQNEILSGQDWGYIERETGQGFAQYVAAQRMDRAARAAVSRAGARDERMTQVTCS